VSEDAPVFLLSSGWRAGSTLVQRLIVSSREILVWGEPYRNALYVQRFAEALRSFTDLHPNARDVSDISDVDVLVREFIATLSPHPLQLKKAQVRFFQTLYGEPTRQSGYPRWGLKEVRLNIDHARYLRWLFPRAKFVFVYRNPYDAFASYRLFETWYASWPDIPIISPRQFGHLWNDLLRGFLEGHQEVDGFMLRFEEVITQKEATLAKLGDYLNVRVDPAVLDLVVSGRGEGGREHRPPPKVPAAEMRALHAAVKDLAQELGYRQSR
jgi:hypothetical protein